MGVLWYSHEPTQEMAIESLGAVVPMNVPIDILGTRAATTTTYANFTGNLAAGATTTTKKRIGNYVDMVTFDIFAANASSSPGVGMTAYFSVLGSNDTGCETATTSTIYNVPITSEIRWFDIGRNTVNLANSLTLDTSTTTFPWTGILVGDSTQIVLKDVVAECIAFQANASSTSLNVQMTTRSSFYR
ncbi:MAG: hypothetical protein KJ971_07445 [Firmicutes bacterium]|nr:hypothetical protein [Bacillota bacterium]